jgi:hypothetical protein
VFETGLPAGLFDQDFAHRLRGRAEEMAPTLPAGILVPNEPEIRFVNQGRWLERLAGRQPGRQNPGQATELFVEYRQQFRRRLPLFAWCFFLSLRHERFAIRHEAASGTDAFDRTVKMINSISSFRQDDIYHAYSISGGQERH